MGSGRIVDRRAEPAADAAVAGGDISRI